MSQIEGMPNEEFRSFRNNGVLKTSLDKKNSEFNKYFSFTKSQVDAIRERVKKKKDARELAREEERNYVEFRKMEILYQFRPKSHATLRKQDDSFPRRKRGVSMGFGERKAYFLSLRPNPKYATWFGKKKQDYDKSNSNRILLPFKPTPEKSTFQQVDDDDDLDETRRSSLDKKGKNASNPFIRGCPFWTISTGEEEEMADDDYPVDVEAIEKVLNGLELKQSPFVKKNFDVYAETETFRKDDALFSKELIFAFTVTSVLNMFTSNSIPKEPTTSTNQSKTLKSSLSAIKFPVTWGKTITITTFDVEKREPKKHRKPCEEPLRDIVRLPGTTTNNKD